MAFTRSGRLFTAAAAVVALSAAAPAASQAAFTPPYTTPGSGSSISGIGAGLQEEAQGILANGFATTFPGPTVTYSATGSGDGLNAFGAADGRRDATNRFAGTDEPPTLAQLVRMDLGSQPGHNSALSREIPIASGSIAVLVSFPSGCTIPQNAAYPAGPVTSQSQFVVSNQQLEKAFAGDPSVSTWGQLLPGISGDDFGTPCANVPLTRVVRGDDAGTTFAFKQWLASINPSRRWSTLPNTTWPNDAGATAVIRSNANVFTNGDTAEALGVGQNDGSIGYASLSAAYTIGFDQTIGNLDQNFWIPIHDANGDVVQPTRDPAGITTGTPGANCDNPGYRNVPGGPDPTLVTWRAVTVGSPTSYPLCTLTYGLAWDDSSLAYQSTSTTEQASQRTVKDYLGYALGDAAQAALARGNDSALPVNVLAIARGGQSKIGWNRGISEYTTQSTARQLASPAAK